MRELRDYGALGLRVYILSLGVQQKGGIIFGNVLQWGYGLFVFSASAAGFEGDCF